MSVVTEIGPDLYRISVYVPQFDLQFKSRRRLGGRLLRQPDGRPPLRLMFGLFVSVLSVYLVDGACKRLGWL